MEPNIDINSFFRFDEVLSFEIFQLLIISSLTFDFLRGHLFEITHILLFYYWRSIDEL